MKELPPTCADCPCSAHTEGDEQTFCVMENDFLPWSIGEQVGERCPLRQLVAANTPKPEPIPEELSLLAMMAAQIYGPLAAEWYRGDTRMPPESDVLGASVEDALEILKKVKQKLEAGKEEASTAT